MNATLAFEVHDNMTDSDFQATFEDVLVCDLVLMALPLLFPSLSTEHVVVFCMFRVLAVFLTKCHVNLFVNNNNI